MGRIAIVCINYRTDHESCDLVHNVYRLKSAENVDTYVVDNSALPSPKECFSALEREYPNFRYVSCEENPGYFGAARYFLNSIQEKVQHYEWIIISNSDIEIDDPHFFSKIFQYKDEKIGVLAPAVYSLLSGRDTNPFMLKRPRRMRMHFYKWMFSNYLTSFSYHCLALVKARFLKEISSKEVKVNEHRQIYAPHGAFMIFSRDYFEKGGNFDHEPFLYGEEITVAENCLRMGLRVVYSPELRVIHKERASTGIVYSKRVLSWKKHANKYLADKYF